MKYDLKKPCAECPFHRGSANGWLGSYTPESVIQAVRNDEPFLCHSHVENQCPDGYENPDWQEWAAEHAQHCAGAMIFARKMCKLSRDPEMAEAQRAIDKTQDILFPAQNFIDHHSRRVSTTPLTASVKAKPSKETVTRYKCAHCGKLTFGRMPAGYQSDRSVQSPRYPRRHVDRGSPCLGNSMEAIIVEVPLQHRKVRDQKSLNRATQTV